MMSKSETEKERVGRRIKTILAPMDGSCIDGLYGGACPVSGQHYRQGSVVSNREKEIDEIVMAHWNYVAEVIKSGADTSRQFSFDEVMKMRKWDYTSAARHFYGHGFEDGQGAMAEKAYDRLKES